MPPHPRPLRGLLLDLDGTLIDRDEALRSWLRRRAGLSARELDELMTIDADELGLLAELAIELLHRRPGLARDPIALGQRIRDELPDQLQPDPAIAGLLTRLRDGGLRLGVVSNGGPSQRRKLERARLPLECFTAIVISGEVGLAKPDPRIFALALARLELSAGEVMMIGDSPEHDIAGAHAAGLASGWIARGRSWPAALDLPALTLASVLDLPARLLDASGIKIP
ncbi:HAD family hydrolase [Nannocystaceae bacterium ST9]